MQVTPDSEFLKRWIPLILALTTSLLVGSTAWMLASSWRITAAIGFFILTFFAVSSFLTLLASFFSSLTNSMNQQFSYAMNRIWQSEQEIKSIVTIRPLLLDSLVSFNGWAVEAGVAEHLLLLLWELGAAPSSTGLVVECGPGASTIAVAHWLKRTGNGRIISLEHEQKFANATQRTLQEAGLDKAATVLHAPLRSWPVNGEVMQWYDFDPAVHFQHKIDLLVVDGPPGRSAPMARYPAVPLLKDFLRLGSVVLLHDAHREDEKKIAEMWGEELGVTPELYPNGKGYWLLRLPETAEKVRERSFQTSEVI